MAYGRPRTYSDDFRTLVTVLGRQATQALDRARLYEAEHRGRERASSLAEVAEVVNAQLDRDGTLRALGEWLVARLGDWCAIRVPEAEAPLTFVTRTAAEGSPDATREPIAGLDATQALARVLAGGPAEVHPWTNAPLPAPSASCPSSSCL